ncbi:hypothetical protein [Streptomyces halstedii]|uniref:hypothetical protein n=1 Tax=Streptomyces halstedii TaxID=1944 RepID=UPI0036921DA9
MARRNAGRHVPLLMACALMAWQIWMLFHIASSETTHVVWSCDESDCGTDDLAGGAPMMGAAAVVAFSLMARRFLHHAAPGVALALAGTAFAGGWRAAVGAGDIREDESVDWMIGWFSAGHWIIVAQAVAAAGAVWALVGGAVSLRRTGGLHRLRLGRRLAVSEASLTGWSPVGRGRGRVEVAFEDADGVRRTFPAVVGRHALGLKALVLHDAERPGDHTRSRLSTPRKKVR